MYKIPSVNQYNGLRIVLPEVNCNRSESVHIENARTGALHERIGALLRRDRWPSNTSPTAAYSCLIT